MIKINLLPHKRVKPKEKGVLILQGAIVGFTILVVLGLGGGYFLLASTTSNLNAESTKTTDELTELKKKVSEVEGYESKRVENENQLKTIDQIDKSRVKLTPLMNDINKVMSRDVWLTSISVNGGSVKVEGVGLSRDVINAFGSGIKSSATLTDVNMGDIAETPSGTPGVKTYAFVVTANLAGYVAPVQVTADKTEGKGALAAKPKGK